MGFLDDAAKTVNRFVINNFQDKARQEAIDLILGMMSMPPGSSLIIQNPLHEAVAQEMQSRYVNYILWFSFPDFCNNLTHSPAAKRSTPSTTH